MGVWDVMNSNDKLRVALFNDLYIKDGYILPPRYIGDSPSINSTMQAIHMFNDVFHLNIRNGEIRLWNTSWVDNESLCNRVLYVHSHDLHWHIKDIIVDGNVWDLSSLFTILDSDTKQLFFMMNPLLVDDMHDFWVWEITISGAYSTNDAYKWCLDPSGLHLNHIS